MLVVRGRGAGVVASRHSAFIGHRVHVRLLQASRNVAVVRASSRTAVVVEANIFSRVSRIVRSFINGLVSQAEDPEQLLDQVVQDMQNDVIRMRQASAQALAGSKQLEKRYEAAQVQVDEWLRRAELALRKGDEDLAREALQRKNTAQKTADQLKANYLQQKKAVDGLLANTQALEARLMEAKTKKETLKARAASAKTAKQVQEMIGSLDTSSAVAAFDKMEEKVMAMEAEAESIGQIVGGDSVDRRFRELEAGPGVDDELAQLKKSIGGSRAPRASLPEGRPIRDAIDFELEELRRTVRER